MSISTIPGESRNVTLPGAVKNWQSLLETTTNESLDSEDLKAKELKSFFNSRYSCPVHCECGLVKYLITRQNSSWDNIPAFNYLGVSKLSCSACRIWLESFNQKSRSKFYTKGSHGKYYWPWGMPKLEVPERLREAIAEGHSGEIMSKWTLRETMSGKLSQEYIAYLNGKKERHKARSDSTDPSLNTAIRQLDHTQEASVRASAGLNVPKQGLRDSIRNRIASIVLDFANQR